MKKLLSGLLICTMLISFSFATPQTFTYIKPMENNGILVRDASGKQHILVPADQNKLGSFKQQSAYEYYYTDSNYYDLQIRDSKGVSYEYIDTLQQKDYQEKQSVQNANAAGEACLIAGVITLVVFLVVGLVAIAGS